LPASENLHETSRSSVIGPTSQTDPEPNFYRWPLPRFAGPVVGSALMRQGRPSSRSLRTQGLCKVTVLVPEGYAEGIRQFAEELCARHQAEPTPARLEWRALSPSAELMVSPERSARLRRPRLQGARCGPLSLDRRGARTVEPGCRRSGEGPSRGALARRGGGNSLFRRPGRAVRRWECGRCLSSSGAWPTSSFISGR
jgi:hypothetical protein